LFSTDLRTGLSAHEARARLEQHGRNELTPEEPVPAWRKFLRQFQDVLVILLLIATVVSAAVWFYERNSALPYEAIAIFTIVLLNAIMGYVQTSRAEQAIASLRAMSPAEATVLRDGERQRVPAAELVPGDVLLVEEGDTVPADARLISLHEDPSEDAVSPAVRGWLATATAGEGPPVRWTDVPVELMQPLARELNLSETVFVLPPEKAGDARIRIFTPSSELRFAGHPVLGTAVLLGLERGLERVKLETGAGVVPVELRPGGGTMQQPLPSVEPFVHAGALQEALGFISVLPV